jgi:hypothetical protein
MVKTAGKASPIIQNIVEENISNALHYSNANCRAAAYLNNAMHGSGEVRRIHNGQSIVAAP